MSDAFVEIGYRPFEHYHPIGTRVRHDATGLYGTVSAWYVDLGGTAFRHVVRMDTGHTLELHGDQFSRALARPGWQREALLISRGASW